MFLFYTIQGHQTGSCITVCFLTLQTKKIIETSYNNALYRWQLTVPLFVPSILQFSAPARMYNKVQCLETFLFCTLCKTVLLLEMFAAVIIKGN